ncbi:hypothetical protein V1511DRAFT_503089 [Dipodascopsis uninucleata]
MAFGAPNAGSIFRPTPPDRGSFPLDHDGECKKQMESYLACIKANPMTKERIKPECRLLAKDYLNCRMERGLMRKDDWKNLGLPSDTKETSKSQD